MKQILILCMIAVLGIGMTGCSNRNSKDNTKTEVTEADNERGIIVDEPVVIRAGKSEVRLDEVLYYAYTTQATYETYYLMKGKEMNWSSEMKEGVTWQQGVKSTILDDICRRECFYSLASEYDVVLSDSEEETIQKAADEYFEASSKKLIKKINIKRERLKKIFEKQKIAEDVENMLKDSAKDLYNQWKKGNTVTADEQWESINFNEPIFTLEDTK